MAILNGIKQDLTSEQIAILALEVNKLVYDNITQGGICKIVNDKPLIDNTKPQGMVNGPSVSKEDVLTGDGLTLEDLKAIKADEDGIIIYDLLLSANGIDLNSQLVSGCISSLADKGLISPDQVTSLQGLGKILDPSWKTKITSKSKIERLLGSSWMVEGNDIDKAKKL